MRSTIEAIAARMVGAEEELHISGSILEYIATLPPPLQRDIRRLIFLFEWLPLLVIFLPARFSRLEPADQDRYIEAWGTSRLAVLRTGFRVLKGLSVSTYYQNPESWQSIGYEK